MPEVACNVENCFYWEEGNRCTAEKILIEIDKHANARLETEFAQEAFAQEHRSIAKSAASTCCHTFRPAERV